MIYGTTCYQGRYFESNIEEKMELAHNKIKDKLSDEKHELEAYPENKLFHQYFLLNEEEVRYFDTVVPESDDYTEESLEDIIGTNITLKHNGKTVKAKIMKRTIGPDGKPTGKYNQNPILDLSKYEVEIPDEVVDEYYHNILSENLLSKVDNKGREFMLMK